MTVIIVGLTKDPGNALDLLRVLDFAGFGGEALDAASALVGQLVTRGVPRDEAQAYEDSVRRGGGLVCVHADDEKEGEEAMEIMDEHRAFGRVYPMTKV